MEPGRTAVKTGMEAFNAAKKAAADRAEQISNNVKDSLKNPFRYYLKKNTEGRIIILDKMFGAAMWEHSLKDPATGYWSIHVPCLKDTGTECPLCTSGFRSSYVMFFSIIDLTPYTSKTGQEIPFTKKLLAINNDAVGKIMQKMFEKYHDNKELGMRGLVLDMQRGGEKSASTGIPSHYTKNDKVVRVPDNILAERYGSKPRTIGDVVIPGEYFITPFNYQEIFILMSPDEMIRKYGLSRSGSTPGSQADIDAAFGNSGSFDDLPF